MRGEQEPTYASIPFLTAGMPRLASNNGDLPLMYEAAVAPPFVVSTGRFPLLAAITPRIVVRQYYGGSYPVPPPSFMPRISLYWWGWPYAPRSQIDSAVYGFLRIGHHSNGQEDSFYVNGTPPAFNYESGDFFTNYLEGGVMRRAWWGRTSASQQLSFEWHPAGWMAKAMRPIYGRYRVHARTGVRLASGVVRPVRNAELSLGFISGSMLPGRRDLRSRAMLGLRLDSDVGRLGDFAPFVRYYTGQDYYNIRFDRNIAIVQVGVQSGVRR